MRMIKCTLCGGTGQSKGTSSNCTLCRGVGKVAKLATVGKHK